jgi:GTP cyclohydrolase I
MSRMFQINEEVDKAERQRARLERDYADIRQLLERLGVNPDHPNMYEVDRRIREAIGQTEGQLERDLGRLIGKLTEFRDALAKTMVVKETKA